MIPLIREEDRMISACFTGHRFLAMKDLSEIGERTEKAVTEAWRRGYRCFFSGGAIGYDLLAAETVISLRERLSGLKLYVAVPCGDQSEHWKKKETSQYKRVLDLADDIIVLSPKYYDGCMLARNRFMVDRSSLCICFLRHVSGGGTVATVKYAVQSGITIRNIAMDWPEAT